MKVAVTGHTSGIGRGLYDYFKNQGHEVHGFSRSNGYTLPDAESSILDTVRDFDIFVNNALPVTSQISLLKKLWESWENADKKIIVIGSIACHLPFAYKSETYQQQKKELDVLCKTLRYSSISGSVCSLISIHPGFVSTGISERSSGQDNNQPSEDWCLSVDEIVDVVHYTLSLPVKIDDISLRKK